jgi:adenylate cyclase
MKQLLLLLSFLVMNLGWTWAQSDQIEELAKAVHQAEGLTFVETAIELADAYGEEQLWKASENWAVEAYQKALELENDQWMGIAINREVKAILAQEDARPMAKARAVRKLQMSNQWVTNDSLKLTNLYLIRPYILEKGRNRDILKIEQEIALLEGDSERLKDLAKDPGVLSKRQLAREVLTDVAEENAELNDQLAAAQADRRALALQQAMLEAELEFREAAIENMSADQVRTELMLAEQKNLLDSLAFRASLDSLQLDKQQMALNQQKIELREQRAQRNLILALSIFVVLLAVGIFLRFRETKAYNAQLEDKNDQIAQEKKRSDDLLLNILPAKVAEELKETGKAKARSYAQASVLFTDFEGFTKISGVIQPEQLVEALDQCFRAFDEIAEEFGLEKIKTIGDAYMAAGGIPQPTPDHPEKVVQAALRMQEFLNDWNAEREREGLPGFPARMGIHSGPIIAGVVGVRKFAYDIWGKTVNIAARMESTGEPGKVNISEATKSLLDPRFNCTPRGEIEVKNLGKMAMYFVELK